ncbi:helix-turn-helix transcriptional regulator [Micromonospora sp. NPDC047707]|uniref:helix-turn-helix transcriptional regulator n=1 Tax=Micromonospora sp. NPDC047707 TaxID=3154498 RepID=UPI0034566375
MSSTRPSRPVPGTAPHALLETVTADPDGPLALALSAPAGHGKTFLLQELARIHRQAGLPVLTSVPDADTPVEPEAMLLIDDAHLLDAPRLHRLRDLAVAGHRLVVAHRPWPRRAELLRLTGTLRRPAAPLLPFTPDQTAACLGAEPGLDRRPDLADFVHRQTGGVPRDVVRLRRALADGERGPDVPSQPPRSVLLELGPDLAGVSADARRLLLALAAGVTLPVDLLGDLLDRGPEAVDELIAETVAAGLLGADQQITPLVRRAVVALSPTADRAAVWRRLAESQLARGGPLLPLVRAIAPAGGTAACPAPVLIAAAEEALAGEPTLAAELYASATAAGHPAAARQALAVALAGDLDAALRLADRLLATAAPTERAEAALVAATALAHRGQARRSVELYRWSGSPPSAAFAAVGALAIGHPDADAPTSGDTGAPPTLHGSAARLLAEGVRASVDGPPTAALSTLVQAAALLEPDGRAVLLPDSPAALAALTGMHCGELDIAEGVLHRAVASGVGGPLMVPRHRLLQAWIAMLRGRTVAAGGALAEIGAGRVLESRDLLFATALELGVARRNSDLAGLQRGWGRALEAVVRHPVDLFTLLPLGELAVVAARLGDLPRLEPYLREARELLGRLGDPPLWSTPLHWSGLHAAILADQPAVADEHVAALLATADRSRYAAVVAAAGASWVEVLRGSVDPVRVEAAARGLHDVGLRWDAARLAGQAAIRTADRRAMTTLLDCARMLQERPPTQRGGQPSATGGGTDAEGGTGGPRHRLSEREQEVAELVVAGLTYREIGDRLFISAKTVEHHVARMRSRLNCASRAELLALLRTAVADRSSSAGAGFWPERRTR